MPTPRTSGTGPRRVAALLLLAAAALFAVRAHSQPSRSLVNRPAPEFVRPNLAHHRVDLAGLRGKVVLLNFWATWCAPCRLEMPRFIDWQKQYGPEGLQIVGVSIDDDATPVRPLIEKLHVNYPILMGDAQLGERYGGVLGVPVTFLIDRRGMVRARIDGAADLPTLEKQLRQILAAR
ncbi:MAG TPA: TlpA disulfide reductase family protein [Acidobacteriaceae bacterium]|nr:TlpA disulfide reductase family protein [Acidobacteriaceae bacterium]